MGNTKRPTQHRAPTVIIEVRLKLRLSAQRELLGIGVRALPLKREITVNALASAIGAIANESAISSSIAALASWPAAAPTATESTAASSSAAESTAATTTRPAKSGTTPGCAWNSRTARAWLSVRTSSRKTTGSGLDAECRSAQAEIILAALQTGTQRSVHQESFVGIGRRRLSSIRGAGRSDLVQIVFRVSRRGAEATGLLTGTLRELSLTRLQLQRPLCGL